MLVKYWKGMLRGENFASEGWDKAWKEEIEKAEAEKCTLVVFKIPDDHFGTNLNAIKDIEEFLQDDYNS